MITVENLTKHFDNVIAVDNISFSVKKGEILGLLGPNGAGKTTTMRMMTGYLKPTKGKVKIDNIDPEKDPVSAKKKIGYLPENSPLYPEMNVLEYLNFIGKIRGLSGKDLNDSIIDKVRICGLIPMLYRDIGTLSKGYRQRVGIARVLLGEPDVLILDEPTSGLDPNQIVEIRELIKNIGEKRTVILSTHILPEITATCNNVLIINDGKIVAHGSAEEIMQKFDEFEFIRILIRGQKTEIENMFNFLELIRDFSEISSKSDIFEYKLKVLKNKNAGEIIFKEVFSRGLSIIELKRENNNLEQSFIHLTKGSEK